MTVFILLVYLINLIEGSAKCGKMWEYHDPEWGDHDRRIYGEEFGLDEGRRTTCICPEGEWISRVAGFVNTGSNWWEDGLDAISVKCSGSDIWEKSMGYYDDKNVWAEIDKWTVTQDWGPICGISVEINNAKRFTQAFKFIYMDDTESKTMGMTGAEYPGTWYKDACEKEVTTARHLVGFTISNKWTIYTFQPIWAFPKCEMQALKMSNLPQGNPALWVKDLKNNAWIINGHTWNGGSPVYELHGMAGTYQLFRSNKCPLKWRVVGISYDGGGNKLIMTIPFSAADFSGFCFETLTTTILSEASGFDKATSTMVKLARAPKVVGFQHAPVEYNKNSAMWTSPLSNNVIEWTQSLKNSKTHASVQEQEHQAKFSSSVGVDLKWNVGTKVGVSMNIGTELSSKIGTKFKEAATNSEGFTKTCRSDLRMVGVHADYTVWIWEYTRERKYSKGTDQMLSCHSWVKSGPCQILPPNCLPPGGCNPPNCITCVTDSLELIPHDEYVATQKKKFGEELVERCAQDRHKVCDPRAQDYKCCEKELAKGKQCGLGEGGCTHNDQCIEGSTCKEMEGDEFGGPRDMPVCVTDHNRRIHLAQDELSLGTKGDKKGATQKVGRSVEVDAQRGDGIEVLESEESVTEGISLDEVEREETLLKLQTKDDWKSGFTMELPTDLFQGTPPSEKKAQIEAGGGDQMVGEQHKTPNNDDKIVRVGSSQFTSSHFALFFIFLFISIWWLLERRKNDNVNLEFPLLESYL